MIKMKPIICILIFLVLLPLGVLAQCNETICDGDNIQETQPILTRLFQGYSDPNNGICDDGENLFVNNDCQLTIQEITYGKILYHMWFIRLIFLIGIIMYFRKSQNFPIIILAIITLLIINGAFGFDNQIETKLNSTDAEWKSNNLFVNDLYSFGGIVSDKNPIYGAILLIALIWFVFIYLPIRLREK